MCVPSFAVRRKRYAPLHDVNHVAPPPPPKRPRPRPLSLPILPTFTSTSPLSVPTVSSYASTGAGGYIRTPLSARSSAFESFRDDHGIKFTVSRHPFAALLMRWRLLEDEDAERVKLGDRVGDFMKKKGHGLKKWVKKKWRRKG